MTAIARLGDKVMSPDGSGRDCAYPVETSVGEGNGSNVFSNGVSVAVAGSKVAAHNRGGCKPDESVLTTFSSTVFVGGKGVGRIGDAFGDNVIIQGSASVFTG